MPTVVILGRNGNGERVATILSEQSVPVVQVEVDGLVALAVQVVSVAVLKAGTRAEGQEQVDAISGATITSTGVSTMLNEELVNNYVEFLNEKEVEDVESED